MTVVVGQYNSVVVAAPRTQAVIATGVQGPPGPGLNVRGYYATFELLQAEHPTGSEGDAWVVGNAVYYWNGGSWATSSHLHVPLLEVSGPRDIEIVVDDEIPGPGWPIAINRVNGHGKLARADTYALSFVIGLSKEATPVGFVCFVERFSLTLSDWTAVSGSQYLDPGQAYFLGKTGGLVSSPDLTGEAVSNLGESISATVLNINIENPILL